MLVALLHREATRVRRLGGRHEDARAAGRYARDALGGRCWEGEAVAFDWRLRREDAVVAGGGVCREHGQALLGGRLHRTGEQGGKGNGGYGVSGECEDHLR